MFWVKLNDLFRVYCIILMTLVWLIVLCLIYSAYKEDEEKVNGHDSIKNVNKNINKRIDKEAKRFLKYESKGE